ncbi:hypothetical protein Q8A67_014077 [Cirrhinus molitorella]|uniref:Uncharacterized protein n=1 Tax=Cirrhinus molitorella TaxID=172907 RepID=A0AA88TMC1_9TELE|nr:hypothetical protein Q8A67_014077 [Cirrhinus molitorella]
MCAAVPFVPVDRYEALPLHASKAPALISPTDVHHAVLSAVNHFRSCENNVHFTTSVLVLRRRSVGSLVTRETPGGTVAGGRRC